MFMSNESTGAALEMCIEITLRHGRSSVNLLYIFRTSFPKNTLKRLLLKVTIAWKRSERQYVGNPRVTKMKFKNCKILLTFRHFSWFPFILEIFQVLRFFWDTAELFYALSRHWNHLSFVMFCVIWYHLYNFKNLKSTHGGVLLLVKLQAKSLQLY